MAGGSLVENCDARVFRSYEQAEKFLKKKFNELKKVHKEGRTRFMVMFADLDFDTGERTKGGHTIVGRIGGWGHQLPYLNEDGEFDWEPEIMTALLIRRVPKKDRKGWTD